mmetsp:Transcript_86394/g.149502  ORF Transcript_86394/g.149502 Transcript_86394/m.149502 type:complete len:93 (+) Transcript_86394:281-559(+)
MMRAFLLLSLEEWRLPLEDECECEVCECEPVDKSAAPRCDRTAVKVSAVVADNTDVSEAWRLIRPRRLGDLWQSRRSSWLRLFVGSEALRVR